MNTSVRTIICLIIVSTVGIIGCSSSSISKNEVFSAPHLGLLREGMTTVEFDTLYGKPTRIYPMQFGKETGRQWKAVVYEYKTVKDPLYKYNDRYLTNTFVFSADTDPPRLNHWKIEYKIEPKSEK